MFTFTRKQNVYTSALAVGLALAFVALSASAASTISTNITTNGTLTVDGASTLTGVVTVGSTATSTFAGNVDAAGDIEADQLYTSGTGTSTFSGGLKLRTGGLTISTVDCSVFSSGGLLTTDASGNVYCTDDSTSDGWVDDGIVLRLQAIGDHVAMGTTTETDVRSVATLTATSTAGSILTLKTRAVSGGLDYSGSSFVVADSASTTLFSIDGKGRIAGFVSSASSTINGALTVSGAVNASSTVLTTGLLTAFGGFISNASSTVGSTLTVSGVFQASSTALISGLTTAVGGFISNASSTVGSTLNVSGVFQASSTALTGGLLTAAGGIVGSASSTVNSSLNVSGVLNASSTVFAQNLRVDTGTLGVGATSTPGQEVGVLGDVIASSGATTTIMLDSTDANSGGCLQLRSTDGVWYRLYIAATSTASVDFRNLVIDKGSCQSPS
ncbi:MAG: hypothetical protein U1A28_02625 [Patescibacteria group bacterium]|nr:hypothetical protein [Patescibacteria group bacterium]